MIDKNVALESCWLYLVHLSLVITNLELTACHSSPGALQAAAALLFMRMLTPSLLAIPSPSSLGIDLQERNNMYPPVACHTSDPNYLVS